MNGVAIGGGRERRLNSGDVFTLLSSRPETNPSRSVKKGDNKEKVSDWVRDQEITFTSWINGHLKSSQHATTIPDLRNSLKDGLVLIELMKVVAPQSIQFIRYHKTPRLRLLKLENVQIAFDCMKREGLQLLNIEPADIVDGNLKLTLGLLQQLANHYPLQTDNSKMTSHEDILTWLQAFLPEAHITDLSSSWTDGVSLSLLVDTLSPGIIPNVHSLDPNEGHSNILQAMTLANDYFQIPQAITPQDMLNANEDSIANYLSYFCGPESPGYQYIIDWINKTIPEHSIINFTSDWLDGLALSSLVNTYLPGTISLEDEAPPLERVKYIMKAAQEELNIEQTISPRQFISKDTEDVRRMSYLVQFIHLRGTSPLVPVEGEGDREGSGIVHCPSSSDEVAVVAPTNQTTFSSDFTENNVTDFVEDNVLDSPSPLLSSSHPLPLSSHSPSPVEKFELSLSSSTTTKDRDVVKTKLEFDFKPEPIRESYEDRRLREQRKSEIDELVAAAEFDFDLVLKEIDDIGKTDTPPAPPPAPSSGLVKSSENLEMDFDFSSDEGGTSSSCQSPVPPPVEEKKESELVQSELIDEVIGSPLETTEKLFQENELQFKIKSEEEKKEEVDELQEDQIDEGAEIIQVTYVTEGPSQLSTASPEPRSEYTTSRTPSPEMSPSPFPEQEEEVREKMKQEVRQEEEVMEVEEGEEEEEEKEPVPSSLSFPNKCLVEESALQCGIINHPVSFIVDCTSAGRGRLEVIIEDANGENLEADGAQLRTNVFQINFVPLSIGPHKISVIFGEYDVPNSPFLCQVSDPLACTASGPGLDMNVPCVGKEMSFLVDTTRAGPGSLQATFSGDRQPTDFQLLSCRDGVCSYRYLISIPGEYSIDIKWAGHHIRGSPFTIIVPKPLPFRPDACTVLQHPLDRTHVGDEIKVTIDCSRSGYGELKALLVSNTSEHICQVSEDGNKVYTVTSKPTMIGKHSIILQYGGEEIPQSPIIIYVNNPQLIQVNTASLTSQQSLPVNKQFSFSINTAECGEGLLSVKVQTTSGIDHARVQRKDDHNYIASYLPTSPGVHNIEIFYDNRPCLSSPLSLQVSHQRVIDDITLVKTLPAHGNCFHLNKMVEFHVHAPSCEAAKLKLSAVGSRNENRPYTNISHNGSDKYTLQLRATRSDDYLISITYDGLHLNGSPFSVPIRSPPKPNKVAMFDPVIPLQSTQPLELVFDISQAGKGSFAASAVNSKGHTMPVYVEQVNNELYRVSFIPRNSDTFMVTVLFADKHINGSPFRVLYKEQDKTPPVCVHFEPSDMSVKGLMGAAVHGRNCGRQEATVVQYERGKYQVSFSPSQPDVFDLHMYWFDNEIEGSPFEIDLLGIDNESSESLVDSIPYCGEGEKVGMLAATAAGRETGPVPVHLSLLEGEEEGGCSVEFVTQTSGDSFDVNLFWNGKPLQGMPVNVQL